MAKISLKEKLAKLSLVELFFTGITQTKTQGGEMVAVLQLDQPIDHVRGSQEVDFNGRRQPVVASDVTEIKVHENDFNDDFQWDEDTNTGSYKGSALVLDVAKTGQVWLRSTSFAASGNEFRTKQRNDRLALLFKTEAPGSANAGGAAKGTEAVKPVDVKPATAGGAQPAKTT